MALALAVAVAVAVAKVRARARGGGGQGEGAGEGGGGRGQRRRRGGGGRGNRREEEKFAAAQQSGRTRLARLGLPQYRAQEVHHARERHRLPTVQQRRVEHSRPLARPVAALATTRDAEHPEGPSFPRGAHRGHIRDPRGVAPREAEQLLGCFLRTEEAAHPSEQRRVLVGRRRRCRPRKPTPFTALSRFAATLSGGSSRVVAAEVGVHQLTHASTLQAAPLVDAAAKRHGATSGILADGPGGG